jgi:hypothetical protein
MGTKGVIFSQNTTSLGLRLFKSNSGGAPDSWKDLEEMDGVFKSDTLPERGYDQDGWIDPGEVMIGIVNEIVEYLENEIPIGATKGDDMRHALEAAIGMRESARNGHMPVKFPIQDRNLRMLPEKSRWFYKKTLIGDDAYMEALSKQKQD